MKLHTTILICLVGTFVVAGSVGVSAAAEDSNDVESARARWSVPKLFDFEQFKNAFDKKYVSIADELMRAKYFLARAFRAFISGIKYKYGAKNYYLAVNPYSDWTTKEIQDSKADLGWDGDIQKHAANEDSDKPEAQDEPVAVDVNEIQRELLEIKKRADEPGYSEIAKNIPELLNDSKGREKRDAYHVERQLLMDDLFKSKTDIQDHNPKITIPESNNPQYREPEVMSFGWDDFSDLMPSLKDAPSDSLAKYVTDAAKSLLGFQVEKVKENRPDEIFVDHRMGGCMLLPKSQGKCGSCYAFAVTAFLEWAYCNETSKFVSFSEQYVVDCGDKSNAFLISGCDGGNPKKVTKFLDRFGVELARNYPYIGKEGVCPYDELEVKAKVPGYIRLEGASKTKDISLKDFDKYLPNAPILIDIATGGDFHEYGGGVHSAEKCCQKRFFDPKPCSDHAVLLVGHGVQDNEEYWLIRNSHGIWWGEEGYYKLSKRSDCISPRAGFMFGTKDGKNIKLLPKENSEHPEELAKHINDRTRYGRKTLPMARKIMDFLDG